jgi:UDP-2,3-diacylglucosamine hydrolase
MKKTFTNSISKFLFRWIHPDIGVSIAQYFSMKNKLLSGVDDIEYKGEDNEWLVQYAKKKLNQDDFLFFVFGHRHLPLDIYLSDKARYINLGDWISYYSFAEFDGNILELKYHNI